MFWRRINDAEDPRSKQIGVRAIKQRLERASWSLSKVLREPSANEPK